MQRSQQLAGCAAARTGAIFGRFGLVVPVAVLGLAAFLPTPDASAEDDQLVFVDVLASSNALDAAESQGGISLDESFYDMLAGGFISPQNVGRRGAVDGAEFKPYATKFNDLLGYKSFTDLEAVLGALGLAELIVGLGPWGPIVQQVIILGIDLLCGGSEIGALTKIELSSVFGSYRLQSISPRVEADGLHLDVTLDHVGVLLNLQLGAGIGDPEENLTCFVIDDHRGTIGFDGLLYDVHFVAGDAGAYVPQATLVSPLPDIEVDVAGLGSASGLVAELLLLGLGDQSAGGTGPTLQDTIAAFATDVVPGEIAAVCNAMIAPYLPQPGAGFDLGGTAQSNRFATEGIAGWVGPAIFQEVRLGAAPHKLQRGFARTHSEINPGAGSQACLSPGPWFEALGPVAPPFASDHSTTMGTLYLDSVAWRHPLRAGRESGVGAVSRTFAISPGGSIDDAFLAPEYLPGVGSAIGRLFHAPMPAAVGEPQFAVPLSQHQRDWFILVAGARQLWELPLTVEVCPLLGGDGAADPILLGALGSAWQSPPGVGTVVQHAMLELSLGDVFRERYLATFSSDLRLDHHGLADVTEFTAVDTRLDVLTTIPDSSAPIDSNDITGDTAARRAPVSLFLRALFGDPQVPLDQADPRVRLMIEGLAAPLVERPHHGMVSLPGLDLPAIGISGLGAIPSAIDAWASQPMGFMLDVDPLCAVIQRFGEVEGDASDLPSGSTPMIAVEVNWQPGCPGAVVPDVTIVDTAAVLAQPPARGSSGGIGWLGDALGGGAIGIPGLSGAHLPTLSFDGMPVNPSRFDDGFMRVRWTGTGDATKLVYAGGELTTAALPGIVTHYVVATAAGYQRVRALMQEAGDPLATIELLPYRPPPQEVPSPPWPTDPERGYHHDAGRSFAALAMRAEFSCDPLGTCDGRAVWIHTAPLFQQSGWIGVDYASSVFENPITAAPDGYVYDNCVSIIIDDGGEVIIIDDGEIIVDGPGGG